MCLQNSTPSSQNLKIKSTNNTPNMVDHTIYTPSVTSPYFLIYYYYFFSMQQTTQPIAATCQNKVQQLQGTAACPST